MCGISFLWRPVPRGQQIGLLSTKNRQAYQLDEFENQRWNICPTELGNGSGGTPDQVDVEHSSTENDSDPTSLTGKHVAAKLRKLLCDTLNNRNGYQICGMYVDCDQNVEPCYVADDRVEAYLAGELSVKVGDVMKTYPYRGWTER